MTRLALVRVPDDVQPDGLIGWCKVTPARRYAIVADPAAWLAWAKEHAPEQVSDCGHVDREFERNVRDWYAATGSWPGPNGEDIVPDGLKLRRDAEARIHATTPHGTTWESAVDVEAEDVPA